MNQILMNSFPKKIKLSKYLRRLEELGYGENCVPNILARLGVDDDDATIHFLLNTTREDQFRLSYALYGYEGGVEAYFPFTEESLLDFSDDLFGETFSGGYKGDDIVDLENKMYTWLNDIGGFN